MEVDRLQSGLLQLSEQTVLLINETCLTPGELNETGNNTLPQYDICLFIAS